MLACNMTALELCTTCMIDRMNKPPLLQVRFYSFQFLCSELAEETQELHETLGDLLDRMPDGGVFPP